ncbi:hypothetical protein ACIGO9_29620 [Nocardia asteroides]|uniref:hypothetical protein n=1 Tax=Nocardia asteroides TaxID=1824 RepID=UPI0037CAF1FF
MPETPPAADLPASNEPPGVVLEAGSPEALARLDTTRVEPVVHVLDHSSTPDDNTWFLLIDYPAGKCDEFPAFSRLAIAELQVSAELRVDASGYLRPPTWSDLAESGDFDWHTHELSPSVADRLRRSLVPDPALGAATAAVSVNSPTTSHPRALPAADPALSAAAEPDVGIDPF